MMDLFCPAVCTGLPSDPGTMPFMKCSGRCPARFSGRSGRVRLPTGSGDDITCGRSALSLARQNRWQPTGEALMLGWLTLPEPIWYVLASTIPRRVRPPLGLSAGKQLRFKYLASYYYWQYGLKHLVNFEPPGYEVRGGMGYHAARLFAKVVACARFSARSRSSCRLIPTWTVMDFGSFYSQAISFTVV